MLSVLVVAEEWYHYKELEECLINDYYVEYATNIASDAAELSKIEFSYEILFYLKRAESNEIAAISRLAKNKVMIFRAAKDYYIPLNVKDVLPVADKLVLKASAMRGDLKYFRGVDKIAAFNAYHIEPAENCEIILNGNKDTKAMIGDLAVRTGKSVIFGVRKENLAVFSADIFSNEAMKIGDNCRFIKNLLSAMVGGAELY